MSFAAKLKAYRIQYGWTQQELADKIGVSRACITQYELGTKAPTIFVAVKLAQLFDTTCEKLIENTQTYERID